jgi:hypothetical protein
MNAKFIFLIILSSSIFPIFCLDHQKTKKPISTQKPKIKKNVLNDIKSLLALSKKIAKLNAIPVDQRTYIQKKDLLIYRNQFQHRVNNL